MLATVPTDGLEVCRAVDLTELLTKKKKAVCSGWFDRVAQTYPPETADFLRRQKDDFANPVGSTVKRELASILDSLIAGDAASEEMGQFVDRIVRVRAVQDFTASQAVGFILELKSVLRQELSKEIAQHGLSEALGELEQRVDSLCLLAFDIYMGCREQIYDIKSSEMRNIYAQVLKRSGMFYEIPGQEKPEIL